MLVCARLLWRFQGTQAGTPKAIHRKAENSFSKKHCILMWSQHYSQDRICKSDFLAGTPSGHAGPGLGWWVISTLPHVSHLASCLSHPWPWSSLLTGASPLTSAPSAGESQLPGQIQGPSSPVIPVSPDHSLSYWHLLSGPPFPPRLQLPGDPPFWCGQSPLSPFLKQPPQQRQDPLSTPRITSVTLTLNA